MKLLCIILGGLLTGLSWTVSIVFGGLLLLIFVIMSVILNILRCLSGPFEKRLDAYDELY